MLQGCLCVKGVGLTMATMLPLLGIDKYNARLCHILRNTKFVNMAISMGHVIENWHEKTITNQYSGRCAQEVQFILFAIGIPPAADSRADRAAA